MTGGEAMSAPAPGGTVAVAEGDGTGAADGAAPQSATAAAAAKIVRRKSIMPLSHLVFAPIPTPSPIGKMAALRSGCDKNALLKRRIDFVDSSSVSASGTATR